MIREPLDGCNVVFTYHIKTMTHRVETKLETTRRFDVSGHTLAVRDFEVITICMNLGGASDFDYLTAKKSSEQ